MKKNLIALLLLATGIAGCSQKTESLKPSIVVSFYTLAYFTEQIVENNADILTITPAGREPHDTYPTPRQIEAMNKADLVIAQGGYFEPWSEPLYHDQYAATTGQVLVMSHELEFMHTGAVYDSHLWLDPLSAVSMVEKIHQAVVFMDPNNEVNYTERTNDLIDRLKTLDQEYQNTLSNCERKKIFVMHNAFSYLAKRYNLETISLEGLSPQDEPSLEGLRTVVDAAKSEGVTTLFVEPLVNTDLAKAIANEADLQILTLNPLEGLTEEQLKNGEDYFSIMRSNLESLKTDLLCK